MTPGKTKLTLLLASALLFAFTLLALAAAGQADDSDGDGVVDVAVNCPLVSNVDHKDTDDGAVGLDDAAPALGKFGTVPGPEACGEGPP